MFDGITIGTEIPDGEGWLKALQAQTGAPCFFTPTDTESGEIKARNYGDYCTVTRRAKVGHYDLILKEKEYRDGSRKTYLTVKGSLHKNHFGGTNYKPFTLPLLIAEIQWLESLLLLPAAALEIHGLEFGVNLSVPFTVSDFVERQALLFGTGEMILYKPANGVSLGRYCPGAEKALKLYDKGLQNSLPFPLMRYELRFKKMRELTAAGIRYLSDLLNPKIYPVLLNKLLACWDCLLIAHPFTEKELETLPNTELLKNGCYRDFWKETHRGKGNDRFKYLRKKYRTLLSGQGKTIQTEIRNLIGEEWQRLSCPLDAVPQTDNYPKSPLGQKAQTERPQNRKNQVLPKITIKINGDFGESDNPIANRTERVNSETLSNASKVRRCLSCNRDISHQSGKTLFCSPKFVGEKEAHRCRNAFHNRRRDMRARAHRDKGPTLFDTQPLLKDPVLRLANGQTGYKYRVPPPSSFTNVQQTAK